MLITNPTAVKVLVAVALFGLFLSAVASFWPVATKEVRKLRWKPGFAFFAVVAMLYGGTKPTRSKFTFDGGIKDAAEPSYAMNDAVVVRWQRDPRAIFAPQDNAPVYIDYRPSGSTNEWGMLAQSVVNAWGWTGELEAATNYDFNVYAYYIPPEPVHTNGVWQYRTITDPERKRVIIPLRATIKYETHTIYPPTEK